MSRSVEFRATATLTSVRRVAAGAGAWCRARLDDRDACRDVELAVDEACTNIVRHAHPGDPSAVFRVRLDLDPSAVCITITDRGPRFAGDAPASAPVGSQPGGGLGLRLIRESMHEVRWSRRSGVNVLRMSRTLGRQGAAAAEPSDPTTPWTQQRGW
jgi:anti-sigma regulatory factor (Ser/Thr protein kinase)